VPVAALVAVAFCCSRRTAISLPRWLFRETGVDVKLHNAFKAATAAQGVDMTTVVMEFIEKYVAKNGPAALRPNSRRA
jgi:hypothetical protein